MARRSGSRWLASLVTSARDLQDLQGDRQQFSTSGKDQLPLNRWIPLKLPQEWVRMAAQGWFYCGTIWRTAVEWLLFCTFSPFQLWLPQAEVVERRDYHLVRFFTINLSICVLRILVLTLECSCSSESYSAPHSVSAKTSRRHKPRIGFHPSQHAAVRIAP